MFRRSKEPYRVEGKKTPGYELAEQLEWRLPDVAIYPTGGGTGLVGMWKAFDEMERLGWIGRERPRMFCVQATGCQADRPRFDQGATAAAEHVGAAHEGFGLARAQGHLRLHHARHSPNTRDTIPAPVLKSTIDSSGRMAPGSQEVLEAA